MKSRTQLKKFPFVDVNLKKQWNENKSQNSRVYCELAIHISVKMTTKAWRMRKITMFMVILNISGDDS
jgi:hypothetical protein